MSRNKRYWKWTKFFTGNGGYGCGPKLKDIIEPEPMSKTSYSDEKLRRWPSSSTSSWKRRSGGQSVIDDEEYSSTTFSHTIDASPPPEKHQSQKILGSLAVVKESEDPYDDFRQSMLQMIIEKQIYSRNDLQQLLDCFLKLNSRQHHEVIVRAFMEIWNGGNPVATGDAPPPPRCTSSVVT